MVRKAVAEGVRDAVTNKETIAIFVQVALSAAVVQLHEQAKASTGKWILGAMWAAVRKGSMFIGLGLLIYSVGGWTAVAKLWHVLWGAQ